jgi:thiol-disulfide isomerase/thioredoxin
MYRQFLFISLLLTFNTTVFASTPGEIAIGSTLRNEKLHGFSGKTKKISDFKGKPLLINVWASWCGPCRSEMGSLQRLERKYGGKQFNVIGISTDDDANAAAAFIKQSNIKFENFLDRNVLLENMLGADTIPLTILVDANGRVLEKAYGAYNWDSPEIVSGIAKIYGIKLNE